MAAGLVSFMLSTTVVLVQFAVFGLIAWWLAQRMTRAVRLLGATFVVLTAWMSFVPFFDSALGYEPRADVLASLLTMAGLVIGWFAGRNRRIRALRVAAVYMPGSASVVSQNVVSSQGPRLLWDAKLRALGLGITVVSQVYGFVIGLLGFLIELAIVSDVAGFWGLVVGFCIAPVTFVVAPLYAGFRQGNWMPAILCYGGMVTMCLGKIFGGLVSETD